VQKLCKILASLWSSFRPFFTYLASVVMQIIGSKESVHVTYKRTEFKFSMCTNRGGCFTVLVQQYGYHVMPCDVMRKFSIALASQHLAQMWKVVFTQTKLAWNLFNFRGPFFNYFSSMNIGFMYDNKLNFPEQDVNTIFLLFIVFLISYLWMTIN